MSTTAWIIVIIVVAVVVLVALDMGWPAAEPRAASGRSRAHREEAKERSLRAERASLAAEEQRHRRGARQLDADQLAAVAEREKAAAQQAHERAQQIDPDVAEPEDAPR